MTYLITLLLSFTAHAYELRSFTTDYCTMYKEGTKENPTAWRDCCIEHDIYYWAGGTIQARDVADLRLKECVQEKGYPSYANTIYNGVKLGHLSPIKSEYPWNNGWIGKKKNLPLTESEKQIVRDAIVTTDFSDEVIQNFLDRF